ncbi:hypothetical protein DPMN_185914 [Dreissena polymorpha]|uniref:Uncharacterized protein n=1 Tax=Dreissena polymorpha TaxID=45954 RepID=A0A9D4I7Q1_DREPO|nr:hypothetical protein DPMN_185914 [Dreissena polymorpha]
MSSCADVFIELLSTKNKLLSADTWMMQPWDVELTDDSNRAEQSRKRRRRFKKRNIAEKVNGTCKQDFTCRNGLIAVPTVNKDFICCETTQQKIQVPGVDREMCLKKEFYYCDSTLQKQGLSRSDGKEEDFKKESLLQLRPITRKEIQQLCLDSSHETYIAVTVPQWLPETSVLYYLTSQLYYQASSDNKAPLWKQHNKKTSSDRKAPEHATQNKKCQYTNLDVNTE